MNDDFFYTNLDLGKMKIPKQVEVGVDINGCIYVSSGTWVNRPGATSTTTTVFRIMPHPMVHLTLEIMLLTSDTMSGNCSPWGFLAINLVLFQCGGHQYINVEQSPM